MEKMKMHSHKIIDENVRKIAELFPDCITEITDDKGKAMSVIDFDHLRQTLAECIVEGPQERYHLNWPGKRASLHEAYKSVTNTLRPKRSESVEFDSTKNLFIEGDNLSVLKVLQETYLDKIKVIFIDPPYNTGSDLIYHDDFSTTQNEYAMQANELDLEGNRLRVNHDTKGRFHSDWLSMMYPRLKLSRNLLMKDGLIFISIDDGEQANLMKMCSEVFGEQNFVADILWQKKTSPDARMNISAAHDHILVYAKSIEYALFEYLPLDESRKNSFKNPDNDPRGSWASVDLTGQTGRAPKSQFYEIETPAGVLMKPPEGRCWALAESTFLKLRDDNRIWFGENGNNRPRLKKFLSESKGTRPWTWWDNKSVGHNQEGSQEVKKLFDGQMVFDNPKPVRLIQRIIQLSTDMKSNHIVLDYFAGSGTTAHAVFNQNAADGGNRRCILVQLPESVKPGTTEYKANSTAFKLGFETIADIAKERIKRAGQKVKDETGLTAQKLDIGYRVLKLDSSSMEDIYYNPDEVDQSKVDLFTEHIKPDRSGEDLLFQVLVDWGVDLTLPINMDSVKGIEVFKVDTNALFACFAKNKEITEEICRELAKEKPIRVVFRDAGFASDAVKINVEQIFKQLSPATEVRTI